MRLDDSVFLKQYPNVRYLFIKDIAISDSMLNDAVAEERKSELDGLMATVEPQSHRAFQL